MVIQSRGPNVGHAPVSVHSGSEALTDANRADVSVIMPVYNGQEFVADAVRSALGQTLPPREVIVVDDGSTDSTPEVLSTFGEQITVMRQRNMGVSAARNAGVRTARSEWIGFLDQDDVWKPSKLEVISRAVAGQDEVGLVFSAVEHWWDGTDRRQIRRRRDDLECRRIYRQLARKNVVLGGGSGAVVRRGCLLDVGLFDEQLAGASEDWDLWIRIARKWPILYVDDVLTSYRQHAAQMSTHVERMLEIGLRVLRKHQAQFHADGIPMRVVRSTASRLYAESGLAYFYSGELSKARRQLMRAIRLDPFSTKAWVPMLKLVVANWRDRKREKCR
jgi:glycosyltransferase involved in cell wall biosynthesis